MDNQHKLIKGYRDLPQGEIDMMNEAKKIQAQAKELTAKIKVHLAAQNEFAGEDEFKRINAADPYTWLITGEHELETAIMKIVRAVAQPAG
jgi:hypothetical protein